LLLQKHIESANHRLLTKLVSMMIIMYRKYWIN